jgi:hypothetical protein
MHGGGYVEARQKDSATIRELAASAQVLLSELYRLQSSGKYKPSKEVMAAMHNTRQNLERL